MNIEGLMERRNKKGTVYYENNNGDIVAKVCRECSNVRPLKEYKKGKNGLGGRHSKCKECDSEKSRIYYVINTEKVTERTRNYREKYPDRVKDINRNYRLKYYERDREKNLERNRKWCRGNLDKSSVRRNRRRAVKAMVVNTLTVEQYTKTLEYFGNACALTGRTDNLEQEHAIPQSIGGGYTFENIYPMTKSLNCSKSTSNIFEWFEANRQRFELSQERFNNLIAYLASANAMTVEEYRDHVYWCHANPRKIDEINDANDGGNRQAI
jgi:hypothetical protein